MVVADPGRVHAELVGIERLGRDVGDELVGAAPIALVVSVAEGEITEIHGDLPHRASWSASSSAIVDHAIVENASVGTQPAYARPLRPARPPLERGGLRSGS